jgi:hypothetical protein
MGSLSFPVSTQNHGNLRSTMKELPDGWFLETLVRRFSVGEEYRQYPKM